MLLLSSWNLDVTQNWREQWKSRLQKRVQDNVCMLYRSWKTWKVIECMISLSRPGKSWNFSEGHGKSLKSKMLSENKRQKDKKFEKKNKRAGSRV